MKARAKDAYTVAELVALPDADFVKAMTPTVWSWVRGWMTGRLAQDRDEYFSVAMAEALRRRQLYDTTKNKAFIPWCRIYCVDKLRRQYVFDRYAMHIPLREHYLNGKREVQRPHEPIRGEECETVLAQVQGIPGNSNSRCEEALELLQDTEYLMEQGLDRYEAAYVADAVATDKPLTPGLRRRLHGIFRAALPSL